MNFYESTKIRNLNFDRTCVDHAKIVKHNRFDWTRFSQDVTATMTMSLYDGGGDSGGGGGGGSPLNGSSGAENSWADSHDYVMPKRDPLYIVVPMTIMYSVIFVTGVIGNSITCMVIAKHKYMHTATNYYLFSLAVSDLILLVSGLPQEMWSIWSR